MAKIPAPDLAGDVVLTINDKDVSTCSARITKVFLNQRENVLTIRHDSGIWPAEYDDDDVSKAEAAAAAEGDG